MVMGDGEARMGVVEEDESLSPYEPQLRERHEHFQRTLESIIRDEGSLWNFLVPNGLEYYGLNVVPTGIWYREWAPGARSVYLIGDFNDWNRGSHPCQRNEFGVFEIFLPNLPNGTPPIKHGSQLKVTLEVPVGVHSDETQWVDRIPAWIRRLWQDPFTGACNGVHQDPGTAFQWLHPRPPQPRSLRIYEVHVGVCCQEKRVGTWTDFRTQVLPRVVAMGFTAIQLMGVQEHPYYASFGYQVTNFLAVSSRFGPLEELKVLVDEAHGLGLLVLVDVVQSHASPNVSEGLSFFDGSPGLYFHSGKRGHHAVWGSRLFDYGRREVVRFLLCTLWYLATELNLDGYRFDAVSTIMFHHRTLGPGAHFTGDYSEYFGDATDLDAMCYLMLANHVLHEMLKLPLLTIAEDSSGMATLCRPVELGGVGFDLRLGMALPTMWIDLLSTGDEHSWQMGHILHTLTNRRPLEPVVGYCESHDQSLVGDKTIAFRIMDSDMYAHMSQLSPLTPRVARGVGLHKMIRLVTYALAGEGWLAFMGNEWGHPEWVDFPRPGNNGSMERACRRWELLDDPLLRYKDLYHFECSMHQLEDRWRWLSAAHASNCHCKEEWKVVSFERAGLLFVFNFWPPHQPTGTDQCEFDIITTLPWPLEVVLSSDDTIFGGHGAKVVVSRNASHESKFVKQVHISMPSRTALILASSPTCEASN